jgi:HAD superfamily hydrolase (TIGR01509 family)
MDIIVAGGVKAAIFDLDGTIADSMGVWTDIDVEFFEGHKIMIPQDYQEALRGMDFSHAAIYTKERFSLAESVEEITAEWSAMALHEYAFNIKLKAGVIEYLDHLKTRGVRIGLATASGRELFEPLLSRHGILKYFDVTTTTSEAGRSKNFPDVYLLCAKKLQVNPQSCLVFEDILLAVRAAKSAGMMVVGVHDSHSASERKAIETEADYFIEDFFEAPMI